MHYNYQDLKTAYHNLKIPKGSVVSLKTDLTKIGVFGSKNGSNVLKTHLDILSELIDFTVGTLVVPTASMSLCNSIVPFDIDETPSETGVLTEYIRKQPEAIRSFHPFVSYAALGKDAKYICEGVSKHAFGPETPKARMLELDPICVSIGLPPRLTCTTIHHVEMLMGVPYRYTKEFVHPVVKGDDVICESFYMYVWHRDCDIKKNKNIKIFDRYLSSGYVINETTLGRGKAYSYSMSDFFKSSIQSLKEDIYIQLDEIPRVKPYRK